MKNPRYDYAKLKSLTVLIFEKLGFPREESESIADVQITSDLFGITSHGLQRINMYFTNLKLGRIKIDAKPKIVKETPVSAVIDADDSMGQVAGVMSMELAIRKARAAGLGFVVTRNNNHFGIAGYYSRLAMRRGLLGICLTNSSALQVPTNGKQAMLGSNPIAVAMPAEPVPFMLDLATAVIPAGKLEVYKKAEKPIPEGWAVGPDGKISTDPAAVLKCFADFTMGGILPLGGLGEILGGHKGYGFSILVELFTAILAQGNTSDRVQTVPSIYRNCATFIAVDYGMFGDKKAIEKGFSDYLRKIRDSEKADGETRIYTHGEKEIERSRECETAGIEVQEKTVEELVAICEELGIEYKNYFTEK